MDDLLVECPIHLDAVSIKDIHVFKCGHGFCEPCLEEHFNHHGRSIHSVSCPTCRKPVKRREAFPLFLTPAYSLTQGATTASDPQARLIKELREARTAHALCPGQVAELQNEIDTLKRNGAQCNQTLQYVRGQYETLEERLAKQAYNLLRSKEERNQLQEAFAKLQVENHKKSLELEQALQDLQAQRERVKVFQGYIERYRRKCNLERKKRKAIKNAREPRMEEESLMVVDTDAPDTLRQDEPDFGWLDEACEVKGDQLVISEDEELQSEKESGDNIQVQVQPSDLSNTGKQSEALPTKLPLRFASEWNLGLEEPLHGIAQKRRHHGSRQVSGSRLVKVPVGGESRKLVRGPLDIDGQGRVKGLVALGPRQKLNSKN